MSMIDLVTCAVEDIGRDCTAEDVFAALADELPPGKGSYHVARALRHAVDRGMISRVALGKAGGRTATGAFGGATPAVFARLPRPPLVIPEVRWVFDLGRIAAQEQSNVFAGLMR